MPLTQKRIVPEQSLASGKERVTDTREGFRTFLANQCPGPLKLVGWYLVISGEIQELPIPRWDPSEVKLKCWGAAGYWLFMDNVQLFAYHLNKQLKHRKNLIKVNKLGCRIQQNMIKVFDFNSSALNPWKWSSWAFPQWSLFHQTLVNMGAQPCHVKYSKKLV